MKTATITPNGILLSKLAQKYLDIIETGLIQKSELIALCSFMNNKATKEERQLINETLANKEDGTLLGEEQNKQGYAYLWNQWLTPTGIERKNNPFGMREQEILENFQYFTLKELYNGGNYNIDHYIPLYECHGKGNSFEYHMNKGIINIVG